MGCLPSYPEAPAEEKRAAAANLALTAALEAAEPDDLLPVGLPLDELLRVGIIGGSKGADAGRVVDASRIYVDLTDDRAKRHILEGDAYGGGHRYGTGKPGKSEFPKSWSDEKILGEISDVATDPAADRYILPSGRTIVEGTRDGVRIRGVIENPRIGERIVTAYPINLPRNPR